MCCLSSCIGCGQGIAACLPGNTWSSQDTAPNNTIAITNYQHHKQPQPRPWQQSYVVMVVISPLLPADAAAPCALQCWAHLWPPTTLVHRRTTEISPTAMWHLTLALSALDRENVGRTYRPKLQDYWSATNFGDYSAICNNLGKSSWLPAGRGCTAWHNASMRCHQLKAPCHLPLSCVRQWNSSCSHQK